MKKILALLGIFSIIASTTFFLTRCKKSNESQPNEKIDLSSIITNKDLGEIDNNEADTIKDALKVKNPNLDVKEIEIKNITKDGATIKAKTDSTKYEGHDVDVTYSVSSKIQLSSVIPNDTNIGTIDDKKPKTIIGSIIKKINNPNLLQKEHIKVVGTLTDNEATIEATNASPYKGQVEVKYNVRKEEPNPNKKDLKNVIKNVNLSWINKVNSPYIK